MALLMLLPSSVLAQSSSSEHYRVDQTFFGSGGEQNACSTGPNGYCAKQTAGELTTGYTCSSGATGYCAWTGFNTTEDPFLEFVVTASNIDLGYLDASAVRTASGQFSVRAWQSGGYAVTTDADPPTNTSGAHHQITPMAAQAASSPGTEQFGINLVQNRAAPDPCNAPVNFGSDPQQMPDSTFSFGSADSDYATCGLFRYVKGDRVAYSNSSTSVTVYTVSYIFNIDDTTPAGQYDFRHVLVATATY